MYKADIIKSNCLRFVHRIFEDTLFTRKYSILCKRAVFIKAPFYNYFVNSGSITSTISLDRLCQNDRTDEVIEFYDNNCLLRQKETYMKVSRLFLIKHLLPLSRKQHKNFVFSAPKSEFARYCDKYIKEFNRSGILFRIKTYHILGIKSSIKNILKHGL